jgi:hypothetical protein
MYGKGVGVVCVTPRLLTRLIRAGNAVGACSGAAVSCRQGQSRGVIVGYVDALSCVLPWTGWFAPEYAPSCTCLVHCMLRARAHPTSRLVSRGTFFSTLRFYALAPSALSCASPLQATHGGSQGVGGYAHAVWDGGLVLCRRGTRRL